MIKTKEPWAATKIKPRWIKRKLFFIWKSSRTAFSLVTFSTLPIFFGAKIAQRLVLKILVIKNSIDKLTMHGYISDYYLWQLVIKWSILVINMENWNRIWGKVNDFQLKFFSSDFCSVYSAKQKETTTLNEYFSRMKKHHLNGTNQMR